MIRVRTLIWVLFTAHEDHVLEKVGDALPVSRVVVGAYIVSKGAVGHLATLAGQLVVVLNQ